MDNPQRTLFCLYILFMCLCLPQAIFQTPFSSFLATNGTKCSSTFSLSHCPTFKYFSKSFCNFSHSWESNKSRVTLCLFTPSVTEKFPNISKQTRLKLRESFQEKLTPLSFLRIPSENPWQIPLSADGVGRLSSPIIMRSMLLWVMIYVIVTRRTYYQSRSFKRRFRISVSN